MACVSGASLAPCSAWCCNGTIPFYWGYLPRGARRYYERAAKSCIAPFCRGVRQSGLPLLEARALLMEVAIIGKMIASSKRPLMPL